MSKYNILIVEDHALTRFALLTSLKEEKFINEIFEAQNVNAAYKILDENKIDLILMDLGLPVIDGVQASFEIRKKFPSVKIIVITSHNSEEEIEGCINAGVNAYCSKDVRPEKLTEIIKDVMAGSVWYDSSASKVLIKKTTGAVSAEQPNVSNKYNLTTKEINVLKLLAEGNSNLEIAKKMNISINTIKVHMCAILQKLSVDDRTQAAIKAIRENLT